ncbi:hypothetical protein ELS19_15470 [Halogeometricum borinquense]|uniref:Uncharacterized protein n=1 Tax=Halogeometricum borinquense TaxID=60847 RepID=A0A482TFN2_9EURY|nr:hypothetical protein [Halogeometricum borinquense]RYJ15206.1 hypothetical protein ELS19_15470 [Halogeometricum borinquense]
MAGNNHHEDDTEQQTNATRRTALKGFGGALGFGTLVGLAGEASAMHIGPGYGGGGAYDELEPDEYIWKDSDSVTVFDDQTEHGGPYKYKGVLSASIYYLDVQTNPEGEYEHYFDAASCFTIYRDSMYDDNGYQKVAHIGQTEITISNNATDKANILADIDDDDVGAAPAPSDTSDPDGSDWGDAAFTAVTTAIGEISERVNWGAAALDVMDALVADAEYSAPSTQEKFEWMYGSGEEPSEATNCARFMLNNKDYHTEIDFDITFRANSNAESVLNPDKRWNIQKDANDHT